MSDGGSLVLYSTRPTPHERRILELVHRPAPLTCVALMTPLENPAPREIVGLRRHFCSQGLEVAVVDSGLADRNAAFDVGVCRRIAEADVLLITGGDPLRAFDAITETPAAEALGEASTAGAVTAACSAGAILLGAGIINPRTAVTYPMFGWLPTTLVAPHFGSYDHEQWMAAFAGCSMLGIPNDAMAHVLPGWEEIESLGPEPLVLISHRGEVRELPAGQRGAI